MLRVEISAEQATLQRIKDALEQASREAQELKGKDGAFAKVIQGQISNLIDQVCDADIVLEDMKY
jgi:uncharacterized protein YgiM (DUF1202 family)